MFRDLLSFWKGKDFLVQVMDDFNIMLNDTELMFTSVCNCLLEGTQEPDLKDRFYKIDKTVTRLEREMRRRIIEHLTLQPTVGVNVCLLLMSVIKDAEQLGDCCRNLYGVTEFLTRPVDGSLFSRYFDDLEKEISTLFGQTKDAFFDADEEKARSAWEYHRRINKTCDKIVEELVRSDLSVNEAVCFALIARYFKRIVSHLVNIATSVVLPLSDLDYFDESKAEA